MSEEKFKLIQCPEVDLWSNDSPVCPHCGFCPHWDDYWEQVSFDDEGVEEIDCKECEQTYLSETRINYTFTTSKLEADNERT